MTAETLAARSLGARGSRSPLGDADPAGRIPPAAARVLASLPDWWETRAREAGLDGRWLTLSEAVEGLDVSLLAAAESAEDTWSGVGEVSAEGLGAAYVAALSPGVRSRHGRHYTPSSLAAHLWDMARRSVGHGQRAATMRGLVRDPACGGGALLLPALREHVRAAARVDAQVALAGLPSMIEGVDADPAAVLLANVVLAAEALPLLSSVPARRRRPLPSLARVGDGLAASQRPARVVIMNPPYGRVRLTDAERQRWAHVLYGHANLYGLFMGAALESLDDKGVLAALVPTSFTSGLYFSRLRQALSADAPLREVAFVADRDGTFADVLQETCLAVFTRQRARRTLVQSVDQRTSDVAKVSSPRGALPWLLPRRADDAPAAGAAAAMPLRLSDLGYRCSTGPLVWNRRAADLSRRVAGGGTYVPVVWAADVDGGRLHRDPARDHYRYLRMRERDEEVLTLKEPSVLVQRTTAPEQTRRLVVAHLSADDLVEWGGRVVVENHVNVLRATAEVPVLDAPTLAEVLSTPTIDRVIRCLTGSVAISAYELDSLPFPSADVITGWRGLSGDALDRAVAEAYRPGA
ncbi:MAG: Eco57I restriction-modification methylase domain-containing protein [Motilibacteraceae bacterium]